MSQSVKFSNICQLGVTVCMHVPVPSVVSILQINKSGMSELSDVLTSFTFCFMSYFSVRLDHTRFHLMSQLELYTVKLSSDSP